MQIPYNFFFSTPLWRPPPPLGGAPHTLGTTGLIHFLLVLVHRDPFVLMLLSFKTRKITVIEKMKMEIFLKKQLKYLIPVVPKVWGAPLWGGTRGV
jgi:hypothetical protein